MQITPGIKNPALEGLAKVVDGVVGKTNPSTEGGDFASKLMDVLKEVNEAEHNARAKQNDLMTGRKVDYHDLMITMEKASVALQLTMAVRNKVLEAYSELSRMQI